MSGSSLRESIVHFKEAVMGEPSMEQRQQCVSTTASVMPVALGRVYAQRLLPSGYKVSCLKHVQNPLGIRDNSITFSCTVKPEILALH